VAGLVQAISAAIVVPIVSEIVTAVVVWIVVQIVTAVITAVVTEIVQVFTDTLADVVNDFVTVLADALAQDLAYAFQDVIARHLPVSHQDGPRGTPIGDRKRGDGSFHAAVDAGRGRAAGQGAGDDEGGRCSMGHVRIPRKSVVGPPAGTPGNA
jgi:hypothetical protein